MHIGALSFPTDRTIRMDVLAPELEARGYESLWVAEHTHIPLGRQTPYPGGGDLPDMYWRTMDPFVSLTAAALTTERLKVGTGICLVNQHHPINAAKQAASIDHLSNGRFLYGVGVAWNEDEMQHHGIDPKKRRTIARERILATKALWTQDEASFEGDYVSFSPSASNPKPVQRPHPPIIMGGAGGPVTFRHVVEYCDGWMPIAGRGDPLEKLDLLHQMCDEAGRDPATISISIYGCPMRAEDVDRYREAGVDRVVFWLPAGPPDEVMSAVEYGATLIG